MDIYLPLLRLGEARQQVAARSAANLTPLICNHMVAFTGSLN